MFWNKNKKKKDFYIISHLEQQENDNIPQTSETMIVRKTTLNMKKDCIFLEMALFPFLFPHGHGAYNGKTHFNEYLKYKMNALFSPFTLYKPYLLYMYDLWQSLKLMKNTSRTGVDKNIKKCKTKNPKMSEEKILK